MKITEVSKTVKELRKNEKARKEYKGLNGKRKRESIRNKQTKNSIHNSLLTK